jgi:hypothetical protein
MDDSETVANKYFTHLGFKKIDFEPEGESKPPDFLVNDRIAAEVRRLNQTKRVRHLEQRREAWSRSPSQFGKTSSVYCLP